MVGTMEEARIPGYFKNKGILITGSTGFLGKILVEKILRVQPDVKRIYLPVRAPDAESAKKRVETEVIGKELFGLLRETHGKGFQSFVDEKVVPLAGDIIHENFGVEGAQLAQMTQEINAIVNGAATTNFYERSAGRPSVLFF
jgi:fatty acyl-CoA reductase